jgi:hypothetical protein
LQSYKRRSGIALTEQLYPICHHVHYAVLNARDYNYLKSAGIPEKCLYLLPNPVIAPATNRLEQQIEPFKYMIYPVRAIPRKNIAEILFWAAHPDEHLRFGITLAPKNPQYLKDYQALVDFSNHENLPVDFEAGNKWNKSFEEVIGHSSAVISSSIAEGFGLAYLESWLSGKALVGRKLPQIMQAFEEDGIDFAGMYDQLMIPLDLLEEDKVKSELQNHALNAFKAYEIPNPQEHASSIVESVTNDHQIDFGRLSQTLQIELLKHLNSAPSSYLSLVEGSLSSRISSQQQIASNQAIIQEKYSPQAFADRIDDIYKALFKSEQGKVNYISSVRLLPQFLNSDGFSLLR